MESRVTFHFKYEKDSVAQVVKDLDFKAKIFSQYLSKPQFKRVTSNHDPKV